MRNTKNNGRCEKQTFSKHQGVCRTYSSLQQAFARQLESDPNIQTFQCNISLPGFSLDDGVYTIIKRNGSSLTVKRGMQHKKLFQR